MKVLLASAALVLLTAPGCQRLDPAAHRAALRQISFRLHRLNPHLELALPLDRSSLTLEATLEVDNPSDLPLHLQSIRAQVWLDQGQPKRVAELVFPQGAHLPARGRAQVEARLRLTHEDLRESWTALRRALLEREAATWRMEGVARIQVMGLSLDLPFTSRRESGRPR